MKKKIITIFLICFVSFGSFMMGFNINVPSSYAIDQEDIQGWTQAKNTSELVEAFRYYCKSRNLIIDGSIADAVTSVTTTYFNTICNGLGIDVTALQAEIYSKTYSNTGLQFLFTQSGIATYNRIFAEFLQNNDLSVDDEVDDKEIYNGTVVVDDNGSTYLVYDFNTSSYANSNSTVPLSERYLNSRGTPIASRNEIVNNNVIHVWGQTYTVNLYAKDYGYSFGDTSDPMYGIAVSSFTNSTWKSISVDGYLIFYTVNKGDKIYLGKYTDGSGVRYTNTVYVGILSSVANKTKTDEDTAVVYLTTNNTTINNNDYSTNTNTVINYNGDTYNVTNYPDDDPSDPGGGGGDDEPPYEIPDNPTYTPPDGWGIELPDDITTNNWLLYGLEKKFPWDIPFNMIFALSLLNAEPETPHFTGAIDLKVCTWNYDIDLEPFDTIAGYCREFFFLGFIIGLMLLTRQLIWG